MKSQKGFTLAEVMVSVGMLSIVVLIASVLTTWAIARFYAVKDRLTADGLSYQAENLFRNYLAQAIDVEFDNPNVGTIAAGATQVGRIFHTNLVGTEGSFRFDQIADSAVWTSLAVFYREDGGDPGAGGQRGRAIPTSIFYRRPSATTSGVIFFNTGTPEGLNTAMTPNYNQLFVDRVSYLEMIKRRNPSINKVTSVDIRLRIRYHTNFVRRSAGSVATTWCPAADIQAGTVGCLQTVSWKDIERSFTVSLRNNLMKNSGVFLNSAVSAEERAFGNLYFFKLMNPLED